MKITREQLAERVAAYGTQYATDFERFIVERNAAGMVVDITRSGWKEFAKKYNTLKQQLRPTHMRPRHTAKDAWNFARAQLTAKRVPKAIVDERMATCEKCEYVRTNATKDKLCGICGCGVELKLKVLKNLVEVEENLPRWGCKHPKRKEGKGWR